MTIWNTVHSSLLANQPRPIAHMWRQFQERRLGLIFGAGVSKDLGVPAWEDLLERIAGDPEVDGRRILLSEARAQASSLAETLFQHFAGRLVQRRGSMAAGEVRRLWRDVVRKQLYRKARKANQTSLTRHPYLKAFLPLIRQVPMTVTYNFDNFLERFLELERSGTDAAARRGKPYEVTWSPDIRTRRSSGVIYHPNGFLPDNEAEPASDGLVFCENEFADQLMDSTAGKYAALLHFLSRHTCLLVGLSLNDATLKHLLRQSAQLNPGHLHYLVRFEDSAKPTPQPAKTAVFEANLQVHNLITLFLTAEQIAALGHILTLDRQELISHATANRPKTELAYHYYVTGVPCSGKSSTISCLRSFMTYDEWLDARLPDMSRRPSNLARTREDEIDEWVASQFEQKNLMLVEPPNGKIGIHVLDRCMLDPMSFKKKRQRTKRARTLLEKVCGPEKQGEIQEGMIFYLDGDAEEIEQRCRVAGKEFGKQDIVDMQQTLETAYRGRHMRLISTRRKSRAEVVHEVLRCIFTEQYRPMDIKSRLSEIEAGRLRW